MGPEIDLKARALGAHRYSVHISAPKKARIHWNHALGNAPPSSRTCGVRAFLYKT